ncbi:MAG TPA: glutamine-hydrolyzing carbamoyl-phosphate synthase small subunit [Chloroflexota bacterium]|jgi:carbamoyl-phosphate synthase small subunit
MDEPYLVLADGTVFPGQGFGAPAECEGEVVFTTGMVGYPESLTDPSYRGQILVFTYPLIGNYGIPELDVVNGIPTRFESNAIQVRGVVVARYCAGPSHHESAGSLGDWLAASGIPGIEGVDTRSLTQHLRSDGVVQGRIVHAASVSAARARATAGQFPLDILAEVSVSEPRVLYPAAGRIGPTVAVLDCGVKNNILRALLARGATVVQLPWDAEPEAGGKSIDGVLISNGPGDPKDAGPTVATVRRLLEREVPTFGICYGNQILALAAGAETFKLKWGHRGQNQPCVNLDSGRCYITSQNHGYSVNEDTLPSGWEPWFRNANDQTNEGIRHREKPFSAVQFHPEAHPGPEDMGFLIDDFLASLGR